MPKIIQGKFRIKSNRKIGPEYFKMEIMAPQIARQAKPGQFVHLRCNEGIEPLLRRPFSFHRLNGNNFEILYKIVGQGTKLLSKKRNGDKIDLLGPLGNSFSFLRNTEYGIRNTVLVAGGMGAAPLLALAEELLRVNSPQSIVHRKKKILVLLGAKTKKEILCAKDFKKLGCQVQIATDDGSLGFKGLVTQLLSKVLKLSTINYQLSTIYACGPKPMLKEIARISQRQRISSFGSLEENMACGLGACLGCAVKTKAGFKQVCKDGPVFNLREIRW